MMKRYSLLIAVLAALSLVFTGCSSAGGSGDTAGISAPDMGGASDLAASGGTAPGSTDAALALFTAACNALNAEIAPHLPSSTASLRSITATRQTVPIDETITINFSPVGGGTVVYTGSETGSMTMPDTAWSPSPNTTYNNLVDISLYSSIDGTLTDVIVSDTQYSYTINGAVKNRMNVSASMDLIVGSTEGTSSATIDFALGLGVGSAFSIHRSDGIGAKFLITYAANYARNNINASSTDETAFTSEMESYLASQPATLKVYDDSNNMVYETTLTANDAYAASILAYF